MTDCNRLNEYSIKPPLFLSAFNVFLFRLVFRPPCPWFLTCLHVKLAFLIKIQNRHQKKNGGSWERSQALQLSLKHWHTYFRALFSSHFYFFRQLKRSTSLHNDFLTYPKGTTDRLVFVIKLNYHWKQIIPQADAINKLVARWSSFLA